MDNFEKAIAFVLKWEGGYVNDPRDPGGETKYGICKRIYKNLDIKNLTLDVAKAIYRRDYWNACKCDDLSYLVALTVLDTAVNMGVKTSIKFLQKAAGVEDDGVIGAQTIEAVKKLDQKELAKKFCQLRLERYQQLKGWNTFGKGWAKRVNDLLNVIQVG